MPLASWRNCCKVNRKLAASVVCKRGQSCCCNVSNVSSVSNLPLQLLKPCGGKCQVHFAVRKSLLRSRSMSLLLATCHTPHSDTFLAVAVHKPNCISLARPKGNAGNAQWQLKPCRIICSASAHKYAMVLLCHVKRGSSYLPRFVA